MQSYHEVVHLTRSKHVHGQRRFWTTRKTLQDPQAARATSEDTRF
jgi:hypothetical protein